MVKVNVFDHDYMSHNDENNVSKSEGYWMFSLGIIADI